MSQPLNTLEKSIGKIISVQLKSNQLYTGRLRITDQYMNLILEDCSEVEDGKITKPLQSTQIGHIFIASPGDYMLSVEADGFKVVEEPVTLEPVVVGEEKPETIIINLKKE